MFNTGRYDCWDTEPVAGALDAKNPFAKPITNTITVEQACTILYRYNGGKDGKLEGMKLTDFTDASSVSSWAADGVKWAVENGIYAGSDGKLDPTEAGSRALVATMFANYVKAFG